MGTILKLLALFLVLIVVLAVVATALWGVWGLVGVLALLVVGGFVLKGMAGKLIQKAFMAPFAAKAAVLKGATLDVHSVAPAAAPLPEPDEDEDEDYAGEPDDEPDDSDELGDEEPPLPLVWYYVDATITPQSPTGPFGLWEPGELTLAALDAKPGAEGYMDDEAEDDFGEVADIELWNGAAWTEDEGMKYPGPQRLRLHVGVRPEVRGFRIRYYFEVFGEVRLPS